MPVIHVDTDEKVSRELPAWMVDASICQQMELGSPQLSIAALRQLREVIKHPASATALEGTRFVSSKEKENESIEASTKFGKHAVAAAAGVPEHDGAQRASKGRSNSHVGGSPVGSRQPSGGQRTKRRGKR